MSPAVCLVDDEAMYSTSVAYGVVGGLVNHGGGVPTNTFPVWRRYK